MLFVILWIMLSINYDGMLNDLKVDESDQARSNLVQKVRKKSEADDETLHDRLLVGRSDVGQQVIEGWKETHKFDDSAFRSAHSSNNSEFGRLRVRIKEVKKIG